ncbi:MAG: polysaccharide deacetylase family protein [Lachnospiraceae bacterium]|nr:polysaccharide deacetylase family protein [Lachnospiraceae bacterium]
MRSKNGKKTLRWLLIGEALVLVVLVVIFAVKAIGGSDTKAEETVATAGAEAKEKEEPTPTPTISAEELERLRREEEKKQREELIASVTAQADKLALMYDYDAAIEQIKGIDDYAKEPDLTAKIAGYEAQKAALVVWPDNTKISHLFVHSLIVDTDRAFGKGSSQPVGYNRYMTTVKEFKKMLEQMYERGYVLISIHRIANWETDAEGNTKLKAQPILLPEGKIPFVLSQDDVNYYKYMENNGFAERLVIGEDGKPTCEYFDAEGKVHYGEYDMLPIVDAFLEEHPDFSYRGDKGILAVTGYEGALGYDTGWHMHDLETEEGKKELARLQEEATKVADAIKADGWEFASHSYTHTSMTTNSVEKVIYDTDKWKAEVEPILGPTDIYIYPFGADICDWRGYKGEKYEYLKKAGFTYFCNVDSAQYWIQIHDEYFRMGRINADGERLYHTPEKLQYFFDPADVFDPARPTPVNPDWK